MNPKLHKERIRTSAQRPDIVIAYQNFIKHNASVRRVETALEPKSASAPDRTA